MAIGHSLLGCPDASTGLQLRNIATLGAVVLAMVLSIGSPAPASDDYLTQEKRDLVLKAEEYLLDDRFDRAHATADSLIVLYPDDPIGYVSKAAVYLGQMTDAEANLYPDSLRWMVDTAIALAEPNRADEDARMKAWRYLCLGHAQAYRSLWESRFGSFASALKLGFAAKAAYEQGLEADSTLYDLYGGLGMYHYWKSAKAGILRWLGIFKNDKERGIRELRLAADSSLISRRAARGALVWIWLDMKEYDSVICVCQSLSERFPEGKMFLWPMAAGHFETANYAEAIEVYQRLYQRLVEAPGNYFNLVECDYRLYECYRILGLDAESEAVIERVVSYYQSIPDDTKRRHRGKIAYLRREYRR